MIEIRFNQSISCENVKAAFRKFVIMKILVPAITLIVCLNGEIFSVKDQLNTDPISTQVQMGGPMRKNC